MLKQTFSSLTTAPKALKHLQISLKLCFSGYLPAIGLLEVVISMLISSVILLGAVSVATKGYSLVKENEIRDGASAILIRSLELSRSPFDLKLRDKFAVGVDSAGNAVPPGATTYKQFALANNVAGYELVETIPQPTIPNPPVTAADVNCEVANPPSPPIRVTSELDDTLVMCNLVYISYFGVSNSGKEAIFEIQSFVVYNYSNKKFMERLVSYRPELV